MFDRGLKTLIVTTALLPSAVIALALGLYLSISRLQDIDRLVQERGNAAAMQVAVAARQALNSPVELGRPLLQELVTQTLEERGVRALSIYNRSGIELAHAGPRLQGPLIKQPAAARDTASSDILRFVQPVLPADQFTGGINASSAVTSAAPQGWVVLEYSRQHQTLSQYRSLLLGALIIAMALIAALALAAFTSRRFSHSIATLRSALRQIEHGKFDQTIEFDNDAVLQELAADFNQMATQLSHARIELQRSLEQTNRDLRESLDTVEVQNIELDLARREALEASRIKSEFLANTTHELRTPLNGIIGFTKLLLKNASDPRQHDYLETIRHSAESLLSIINDILDFSKIEAGKLVIDSMPFSLRDLIEDTLSILAPSAQEKNLQLQLEYAPGVPADMIGDPLRLRQVLLNLIGNAIKFTPHGAVTVRVHLAAPVNEGRAALEIEINDTGIGLSEAQQKQMFKPFAQADASTSRLFGGTGLGLVISKKLVEQMGGEISVESTLGSGSTFCVALRLQTLNKPLPAPTPKPVLPTLPSSLQVLAVDDNPTNLRLLAIMLEEFGVEPYLATGGQDALTLAQTHAFDLILLDIQMPDIDGREVARQLRNVENPNRSTQLIALTAHVLPEEHRALLALGFDRCLTKPITEEQLVELLAPPAAADTDAPTLLRPIDTELCLQRARRKPDLARDLLKGVIDMLPSVSATLNASRRREDLDALLGTIHKLHGACCYTGTPALQQSSLELEEILKRQPDNKARVDHAIGTLGAAIEAVLSWQEDHDIEALFDLSPST